MSAKQLGQAIGQTGTLKVELSLSVPVKVLDAREVFSRVDYYVTPIGGEGFRWVSAERVELGSEVAK